MQIAGSQGPVERRNEKKLLIWKRGFWSDGDVLKLNRDGSYTTL